MTLGLPASPGRWRVALRPLAVMLIAAVAVEAAGPSFAEVRTSTSTRNYSVGGTTAASLVSYMRSHPIRGDYGNAVANIRPSYSLSVATKAAGGSCRASNVTLNVRFALTLPKARNALSGGTRSAWNAFAAYARSHEDRHRQIYVQCGNSFVAKAKRMTAGNCGALQISIRRQLENDKRACESRQRAFDRAERGRVAGLSLFSMARSGSRSRR